MAQDRHVFKQGKSWFLRYLDNSIVNGVVTRKQKCKRLAAVSDRYRTEKDRQGLITSGLLTRNVQIPQQALLARQELYTG